MSKPITTGNKNKGTVVIKGHQDLRKITCPRCKQLAVASISHDGTRVIKCTNCGTEYTSRPL